MAFISSSSFFPSAPLSHPKKKVPWSQLAPTSLYRIFPFLPCLISQVASISSPFINSYACVIWFALAPFVPVTPAAWKYPKQSAFKQPSFFLFTVLWVSNLRRAWLCSLSLGVSQLLAGVGQGWRLGWAGIQDGSLTWLAADCCLKAQLGLSTRILPHGLSSMAGSG